MSKFLNVISVFVWCAGRGRGCWILDAGYLVLVVPVFLKRRFQSGVADNSAGIWLRAAQSSNRMTSIQDRSGRPILQPTAHRASSIQHPASHSPPPTRTTPAFQAQTYSLLITHYASLRVPPIFPEHRQQFVCYGFHDFSFIIEAAAHPFVDGIEFLRAGWR